jgi:hypothetical protein
MASREPKLLEQRRAAFGTMPGSRPEWKHALWRAMAMVGDGEAVGLIADALHQVESRESRGNITEAGRPGTKILLLLGRDTR